MLTTIINPKGEFIRDSLLISHKKAKNLMVKKKVTKKKASKKVVKKASKKVAKKASKKASKKR